MKRWCVAFALLAACQGDHAEHRPRPRRVPPCPAQRSVDAIPGTTARERDPARWLAALPAGEADRTLLGPDELRASNERIRGLPEGQRDLASDQLVDPVLVRAEHDKRFADIRQAIANGKLVCSDPAELDRAEEISRSVTAADHTHVAPAELELWCTPMRASLLPPVGGDLAFDRNRCSEIHAGDLVRVRAVSADGRWMNVRTAYTEGWLDRPELGPALEPAQRAAWMEPERPVVVTAERLTLPGLPVLRMGAALPATAPWSRAIPIGPAASAGYLPFTRKNLFGLALARIGARYGWGGYRGGLDCSRFLLDLFGVFGLGLPRNSGMQALAGEPSIDLHGKTPAEKLAAIREASRCSVLLLQMPGHIVLYLGERDEPGDGSGTWVISSIAEMREPCPGGGETVLHLDRVDVSTLAVGRGTTKRSFLERLERIAVFGHCGT